MKHLLASHTPLQNIIFVVTGGLGFIGKHFVRRCLLQGSYVINIDVVNYAADKLVSHEFLQFENYKHIPCCISKLDYLPECDILVNFAAESHVDNSIANSDKFVTSNISGVQRLLELSKSKHSSGAPHFIQISTDEVYGDIVDGRHSEDDHLMPSNPYSATKAAADMMVLGWSRTFGLKFNIVRFTNNYGLNQYPEKLIPKSSSRMKRGLPALMHGDGSFIRSWLHVEDSVDALISIILSGTPNTIYNVDGQCELKNIDVLRRIANILGVDQEKALISIPNRVGQDVRYSLDYSRIRNLGWKPTRIFDDELPVVVESSDIKRFI